MTVVELSFMHIDYCGVITLCYDKNLLSRFREKCYSLAVALALS